MEILEAFTMNLEIFVLWFGFFSRYISHHEIELSSLSCKTTSNFIMARCISTGQLALHEKQSSHCRESWRNQQVTLVPLISSYSPRSSLWYAWSPCCYALSPPPPLIPTSSIMNLSSFRSPQLAFSLSCTDSPPPLVLSPHLPLGQHCNPQQPLQQHHLIPSLSPFIAPHSPSRCFSLLIPSYFLPSRHSTPIPYDTTPQFPLHQQYLHKWLQQDEWSDETSRFLVMGWIQASIVSFGGSGVRESYPGIYLQ